MKHRMMRVFLITLAALLLFGSFGCNAKETALLSEQVTTLTKERYDLQVKLDTAERTLDEMQGKLETANEQADELRQELQALQSAPTPEPTVVTETVEIISTVPAEYALGVDCTVNGSAAAVLDGETKVSCVPNTIEGYVFDHWEVDGEALDTTEQKLELTLSKTTRIRAVFHERHTVTCINCYFQFLTEKGNASGKKYTEFDFEDDYTNPVTKKKETGGLISFYITADTPKKKEVDYWLINGVRYEYPKDITKFRVVDLNEATVFEVVFKGEKKTDSKTYYTVTCIDCKFTGGGNSNAASGKVPAGTVISVVAVDRSSEGYFTINGSARHMQANGTQGSYYKYTITYTVNSDTTIDFDPVVN